MKIRETETLEIYLKETLIFIVPRQYSVETTKSEKSTFSYFKIDFWEFR